METTGWMGLAVALGSGLLIGLERERRKGDGATRAAAGLRTFAVAALTGALAAVAGSAALAAVGLVVVGALAALAYWRSDPRDPGLTTELALVTTYLIGLLAVPSPGLAAACATALAILLALRERLHRWATSLISAQELHDGLLLAAAALIALPLVPAEPLPWAGGFAPRSFAALFVLILGMQATSHVALRAFGARAGWPLAGFLAGFVSSTAAIATLGRQARSAEQPTTALLLASAAACSGVATWVLVPIVVVALAPAESAALLPQVAAGALTTAAVALWWWRRGESSIEASPLPQTRGVLRPREALGLAMLLALTALGVGLSQATLGSAGRLGATAIAALADAHAAVAAQAGLAAAQTIGSRQLWHGVLLAIGVNALSRTAVAFVAGGGTYGLRIGTALMAGVASSAAAHAWLHV